jgi:hypothetical protein
MQLRFMREDVSVQGVADIVDSISCRMTESFRLSVKRGDEIEARRRLGLSGVALAQPCEAGSERSRTSFRLCG